MTAIGRRGNRSPVSRPSCCLIRPGGATVCGGEDIGGLERRRGTSANSGGEVTAIGRGGNASPHPRSGCRLIGPGKLHLRPLHVRERDYRDGVLRHIN